MPSVPIDVIQALQANPKNIRNICIVAHVDHGMLHLHTQLKYKEKQLLLIRSFHPMESSPTN
jgi:hypothetical protein